MDIAERRSRTILQLRILCQLTESVVNYERRGVHWKAYTISCVCRQRVFISVKTIVLARSFKKSACKNLDGRSHSSVVASSMRLKLSMLDVYG